MDTKKLVECRFQRLCYATPKLQILNTSGKPARRIFIRSVTSEERRLDGARWLAAAPSRD